MRFGLSTLISLLDAADDATPLVTALTGGAAPAPAATAAAGHVTQGVAAARPPPAPAAPPPPPPPPPPEPDGGLLGEDRTEADEDGWYFNWKTEQWEQEDAAARKGSGSGSDKITAAAVGARAVQAAARGARQRRRLAQDGGGSGSSDDASGVDMGSAVFASGAAPPPSPAPLKATPLTDAGGFAAMNSTSPGVPPAPPLDASAASNGAHVVAAANSVVQVYSAETGFLEKSARLSALFQPVIVEFSNLDVQRAPTVAFDRSAGQFLLAAVAFDSRRRDVWQPGRVLLAATTGRDPVLLWRVASLPAPPCEPGLYAQPDAPSLAFDRHGVFVSLVLRCLEMDAAGRERYAAPRIVALDKAALYDPSGGVEYVPYFAPPTERAGQLAAARPQAAGDAAYGGAGGAAVFVGQRDASANGAASLLTVYALVGTSALRGLGPWSEAKPRLCEAAVERGRAPAACEPAMAQPAGGGALAVGGADVTYGVYVCVCVFLCMLVADRDRGRRVCLAVPRASNTLCV